MKPGLAIRNVRTTEGSAEASSVALGGSISAKGRSRTTIGVSLILSLLLSSHLAPGNLRAEVGSVPQVVGDIVAGIERTRAAKDSLLRHGSESPLEPERKEAFTGLSYFPVDLRFHVIGELHAYGRKRRIQVPTTANTTMTMERYGRFRFHWEGKGFWLEVYRSLEDGMLSVFFKDKTNGTHTYAGGRYAPISDLGNRAYLLDFNISYSPYCDYNPVYICPLVPTLNILPFPVTAGEKAFGADLAQN